jgi:hypothetical protein
LRCRSRKREIEPSETVDNNEVFSVLKYFQDGQILIPIRYREMAKNILFVVILVAYSIYPWFLPIYEYDYFMNNRFYVYSIWTFMFICITTNMSIGAVAYGMCAKYRSRRGGRVIFVYLCKMNILAYVIYNLATAICIGALDILAPLSIYRYWAEKNGYAAM